MINHNYIIKELIIISVPWEEIGNCSMGIAYLKPEKLTSGLMNGRLKFKKIKLEF